MEACRREFVDSRLRRSPPDREDAVPCGQAGKNEGCFPRLAHRSAAAHKLHGATAARRIDSKFVSGDHNDHKPGASLSLFSPGTCPTYRHHRSFHPPQRGASKVTIAESLTPSTRSSAPTGSAIAPPMLCPRQDEAVEITPERPDLGSRS